MIRCIPRGDPVYPDSLITLEEPPAQLYAIGDTSCLDASPDRMVAIVGTREATIYGLRVARALATAFAKAGAIVVSGLARGIDSAAHEAALQAGGRTVAVLGTGVDVPYPVGNRALHEAVAGAGLVLSESEPGQRAFKGCFPRRNRIIAALARATVVVEAGYKSGALNTANLAMGIGRSVGAIPGPIDAPRSAGCNLLIRESAQMLGSIDDALGLLSLSRTVTPTRPNMGPLEADIWDALGQGEASMDQLADLTDVPVPELLAAVSRLEMVGLLASTPDGRVGRAELGDPGPGPQVTVHARRRQTAAREAAGAGVK